MHPFASTLLILTVFLAVAPARVRAFGAGDIPDFSYLNDKAFRHGDIENILTELAKTAGHGAAGAGLLSFAHNLLQSGSGGKKFNKGDVKKVYFGNWLRDYSQAMDIAGLTKLSADTLVLIVAVLGFMTFGFATEEFEVTADRLGVYLPVEHIDNPKGYAEKEGDARRIHPKLRPPVRQEELEIDERTGMKNYMASDNRGWDTSTAHIRRVFRACIGRGRRSGGREGPELFEAYRLLGTGLHTLEDLLAHSNWCEIALRKMGHEQVFCHVGDRVIINTPNGPAPPLVTGTFGGADFLHSLMGEAGDHLSQASVTDLTNKMNEASSSDQDSTISKLKGLLSKLPIGGGNMDEGENLHQQSQSYQFNPDNIAPPEVQQKLWALLKWRDGVFRTVVEQIEKIPGLGDLIDGLTNALNAYVYTILAPWLTPILSQVTGVLGEGSKAVIDSKDQYEVFTNPHASDPSHSLLSKDHFGLILNEPAGKIAQVVVQYSVKLLVNAWFEDRENPDDVINQILEAFHHPYYNTGRSQIQNAMFQELERWLDSTGDERETILNSLTKESVREGKNKRPGSNDETAETPGGAHGEKSQAYGASGQFTAGSDYLSGADGNSGRRNEESRYGQESAYGGSGYGQSEDRQRQSEYDGREESSYGGDYGARQSRRTEGDNPYGHQSSGYGGESRRNEEDRSYGQRQTYDEQESYGGSRNTEYQSGYNPSYQRAENEGYGRQASSGDDEGYGGERQTYGREATYSRQSETRSGYGGGESEYSGGYGRQEEPERRSGYGGGREPYGRSEESGYGQSRSGDGYSEGTYGEGRQEYGRGAGYEETTEELGYGRSKNENDGDYGRREEYEASGYGRSEETGYGRSEEHGYERSEERGYGGEQSDETFGAERLNLGRDNEGEEEREYEY